MATGIVVVLGEMMTFRCLSSFVLIVTLLTSSIADARPHTRAAAQLHSAKASAHEAAVVARQAKAYYQKKQFALAAELYRRAYELNPARPEFLYGVGRSEQMAGHLPQARAALESLRQLLPPKHPLQAKAAASLVAMQEIVAEAVEVIPPPMAVTPVAQPTPTLAVAPPVAPTPVVVEASPLTVVRSDSPRALTRTAMWTGGALIVAGIALAVWAEVNRSTLAADLGVIRGTEAATRQQTVNSLSTASVISVAAGAGALALGLYWRIGETANPRTPVLTATPSTVQLSWRF